MCFDFHVSVILTICCLVPSSKLLFISRNTMETLGSATSVMSTVLEHVNKLLGGLGGCKPPPQ